MYILICAKIVVTLKKDNMDEIDEQYFADQHEAILDNNLSEFMTRVLVFNQRPITVEEAEEEMKHKYNENN